MPGYEAVRLPLPTSEMPTGLAWRTDGTLVYSSLKGQVWLARDTDGDGLEDTSVAVFRRSGGPLWRGRLQSVARDRAARDAAATDEVTIDVINKNGLLRLYDRDGDGHAERTEVVASGWGHTDDYHDWAVGLARDDERSYYVALPCQQDDRSRAAANLRGWVVTLAPRSRRADDPRRFLPEPIAGGLRFPMGLARVPRRRAVRHRQPGELQPLQRIESRRRRGPLRFHQQAGTGRRPRAARAARAARRGDRDPAPLDPQRQWNLLSRHAAERFAGGWAGRSASGRSRGTCWAASTIRGGCCA